MLVGTVLSLLSAIQPSIEASQVRPSLLIQPGLQQRVGAPASGVLIAITAIACFVIAARCHRAAAASNGIAVAGYVAVLFVVRLLAARAVDRHLAASTRSPRRCRAMFGIVGQLASASLPASLRRTSIAGRGARLAIGMMVAVALMVGSFRETVRVWVDQTVSSDLWLRPAKGLSNADAAAVSRRDRRRIAEESRSSPPSTASADATSIYATMHRHSRQRRLRRRRTLRRRCR